VADPFVLLVEGKDEVHVLSRLLEHHRVPETFRIKDMGGIEKLLDTLDVELIAGGLERLGILVDADRNPKKRWLQIRNILVASGFSETPAAANATGTIFAQKGKRIGVWVMPDNKAAGILEDFVRLLVPPGDTLLEFAEECVNEVIVRDRRFPKEHRSKALIHTWLSWQEEPGTPLGLAIKNAKKLDAAAPATEPLIQWLKTMFGVSEVQP
jgi:hypothetical protein